MNRKWLFLLLLMVCLTQSGCELLSIPGELLAGMFGLAGQALGIASAMPLPPPWMFF